MKRKREMKALKAENERLLARVAHLEDRLVQLEQQLHFYETVTTGAPDHHILAAAAAAPLSARSSLPSATDISTSPLPSMALPPSAASGGSPKTSKEIMMLRRRSRRNTSPIAPASTSTAFITSMVPSSPTTTTTATPDDLRAGRVKPSPPALRNASGDVEVSGSRPGLMSGDRRPSDDKSGASGSWMGMSGSNELEAVMTASGEMALSRKSVGWSDAKPSNTGRSSPSAGVDDELGMSGDANGDDINSSGSGSSIPIPDNSGNRYASSVSGAGGHPSSPLGQAQTPHKTLAAEQQEQARRERREKVEADFKAAQAEWAAAAPSDDEVEPYPFDLPDLPTNILFKDISQAGGHRRPTLTDSSPSRPQAPTSATLSTTTTMSSSSSSSMMAVPESTMSASISAIPEDSTSSTAIPLLHSKEISAVAGGTELASAEHKAVATTGAADTRRIRGGTLIKLVERLLGDYLDLDPTYLGAFLLTYRSFSTPDELLELLTKRWKIPRSSPAYKDASKIHFRVWLVLKTWVRDHFAHDFQHNPELVKRLQKFIFIRVAKSLASPAAKLITQLHRLMADDGVKMEAILDDMPKPIMPRSRSFRRLSFSLSQRARNDFSPLSKFMDFHPLELARQLTLVESSYFREIQPKECLKLCWSTDKANAPNILGLINHFNALSGYVKVEILKTMDSKQRAKVIEYFLQVGKCCQELSNFNALMEITSSLNAASVHRLKNTWKLVNNKYSVWKEDWSKLTLNNYVRLREAQLQAEPPCLPYVGVILSDLTFIEEGNKDFVMVGEHALINFEKRRKVATVLTRLQQCQRVPFGFHPVPQIYGALQQEIVYDPEEMDDNYLYQLSLQREPRSENKPINRE